MAVWVWQLDWAVRYSAWLSHISGSISVILARQSLDGGGAGEVAHSATVWRLLSTDELNEALCDCWGGGIDWRSSAVQQSILLFAGGKRGDVEGDTGGKLIKSAFLLWLLYLQPHAITACDLLWGWSYKIDAFIGPNFWILIDTSKLSYHWM